MERLRFVAPVLFPAALLGVGWACITYTGGVGNVAGIWPVNALVLAFMMRWAKARDERLFVLGMALLVMTAANIIAQTPLWNAIAMPALGVLEIAIAFFVLRKHPDPLADLRAFGIFVGGAVIAAPMISGALAAFVFVSQTETEPVRLFLRWSVANGLGMAIFGPLLLSVGRPAPVGGRSGWIWFALAQAALLAASVQILVRAEHPPLFFLFPFMAAAALSHKQLGGVTAVAITALVATYGAAIGKGPAAVADMAGRDPALLMEILLASLVFTILPVSALLRRLDVYAAELEQRRAQAEELSAVKTRLLAHVSHEIRSPLAGVTTLAQLLRDGAMGELTAVQRESLAQIAASGADVTELARDLTDAASLQSGKATVHLAEVEVGAAILAAIEVARFRTSQHQACIEMLPGGAESLMVIADPLRLRQILVNLLVNAAKYGGRPPVVLVSARMKGRAIRFEVSDNGPGIDKKQRARLFQDFQRLGAEKNDLDGAGLGLALSQQIARLQNGALGVEDSDLGGARFWLELPVKRAKTSIAA